MYSHQQMALHKHLTHNNLYEPLLCGFCPSSSTDTPLPKITNNLLTAADSGSLCILILLDLSATFDTILHPILLSQLSSIDIPQTPSTGSSPISKAALSSYSYSPFIPTPPQSLQPYFPLIQYQFPQLSR